MGVMIDEDTIETAGNVANAIDAGRRVGWAKAFEALRRADSAERDVNVLRADVKILSSFAARIYGALEVTCGVRINEVFRGDNHEFKSFFPQGPMNQGRDAMRKLLADRGDELNEIRAEIRSERAERQKVREGRFRAAQEQVVQRLADSYGFRDKEEMMDWLAQHRNTDG